MLERLRTVLREDIDRDRESEPSLELERSRSLANPRRLSQTRPLGSQLARRRSLVPALASFSSPSSSSCEARPRECTARPPTSPLPPRSSKGHHRRRSRLKDLRSRHRESERPRPKRRIRGDIVIVTKRRRFLDGGKRGLGKTKRSAMTRRKGAGGSVREGRRRARGGGRVVLQRFRKEVSSFLRSFGISELMLFVEERRTAEAGGDRTSAVRPIVQLSLKFICAIFWN